MEEKPRSGASSTEEAGRRSTIANPYGPSGRCGLTGGVRGTTSVNCVPCGYAAASIGNLIRHPGRWVQR